MVFRVQHGRLLDSSVVKSAFAPSAMARDFGIGGVFKLEGEGVREMLKGHVLLASSWMAPN